MTDTRNLSFPSPQVDPALTLNQMKQDASALLRAPAPTGDVKAWHTMASDFYTAGKTGYAIAFSGNKTKMKSIDRLVSKAGTAASQFATVFFNAGVPLGRFRTGNDLVHFVRTAAPTTTTTTQRPTPPPTTTTTSTAPPVNWAPSYAQMQTDYADVAGVYQALSVNDATGVEASCAMAGGAPYLYAPTGATTTQSADLAVIALDVLTFSNGCREFVADYQTNNTSDGAQATLNMSTAVNKLVTDMNNFYASTGSSTTVEVPPLAG